MGITTTNSLFFLEGRSVGQLTFIVHGCLLGDKGHVGGGRPINGSTENAVVSVRRTCEWFPSSTSKCVSAFSTGPNSYGLAGHLTIMANRTCIFCIFLSQCAASISSYANTVTCSKSCRSLCFLGSLSQSVPLLFCNHFS